MTDLGPIPYTRLSNVDLEAVPEWVQEIEHKDGRVPLGRTRINGHNVIQFDFSPEEKAWRAQALCLDKDPDIFFPERGESILKAYQVCRGCAVRIECLESAISSGKDSYAGVRGGCTPHERRQIRDLVDTGETIKKALKPWDQKREKKLAKSRYRRNMQIEEARKAD